MTKTNRFRIFVALMAVVAATLVAVLATKAPASAQSTGGTTFTVGSTGDAADANTADDVCDTDLVTPNKQCTLRAAIEQANATAGADTIKFKIPGSGVRTISPGSEVTFESLPEITEAVTIDGYSQPGASPNTLEQGNDAVLLIELKGTNARNEGLRIGADATNVVVRGLVINGFFDSAIAIVSNTGTNHRVEGNFLGTDPTGTQDLGNLEAGVSIEPAPNDPPAGETNNVIGGTSPDKRNVISGNGDEGIIVGKSASGNKVEGNYIGTQKDGTTPLGSQVFGVFIFGSSSNNTVGGTDAAAANVIAFNNSAGVVVSRDFESSFGTGNRILGNSIFSNGGLGIDLVDEQNDFGVTPNDPKDPDTGPNNLQNFPELASAKINPDDTVTITGTLNSRPRKTFTIQFFSSPEADSSGFGEGKTFLGQTTVKTNRKGNRSFSFTFTPAQPVTAGEFVTATATRNSTGDTSEFSGAVTVS